MMIRLLILITILLPAISFGKTLNPVVMETAQLKFDSSVPPILIDDKLVYYLKQGEESQLWVHDFSDGSKTKIYDFPAIRFPSTKMARLGDSVIFLGEMSEARSAKLWITDLTTTGTRRITDETFFSFRQNKVVENLFFTVDTGSELVSSNGNNLQQYPVTTSSVPAGLCVYAQDNILVAQANQIEQVVNGSLVDLTAAIPEGFRLSVSSLSPSFQFNDQCYIELTSEDGSVLDYLVFSADGSSQRTSDDPAFQGVHRLLATSQALFGFVEDDLVRFNSAITAVEDSVDIPELIDGLDYSPRSAWVDQNALIISAACGVCSPAVEVDFVIGADLELIGAYDSLRNKAAVFSQQNADLLFVENRFDQNNYQLKFADDVTINTRSLLVEEVIVDAEQDGHVVVFGRDVASGLHTIYVADQVPDIGPQINGPWYNPNYNNQGFNFYRGIRANGSHYLNVTGYFHNQGAPFWFAGVGEIEFPQKTIDVRLFDYDGIDFLEPAAVPNMNDLGTLTLQFTECNQVKATFSTVLGAFDVDLVRIDDAIYNDYCVDE